MSTLVISNDFPPRTGGIESFVATACELLDDDVVVLTSSEPGDRAYDNGRRHPVHRLPWRTLLPTRRVAAAATELLRSHGLRRVLFGAAAPLALLTPALRDAGAERVVALSHGHEVWWSATPGFAGRIRRIGATVDALGHISDFTGARIAAALDPADRAKLVRLPPPVDLARFRPDAAPTASHRDGTVRVLAAGRFVPRKGWQVLLQAWRGVLAQLARQPDAPPVRLDLVGTGPLAGRLRARAAGFPPGTVAVHDAVPHDAMPALLAAADVFALPVRTPFPRIQPEGLGLTFVEAAACGLPVLVGESGGAPETVVDGESGYQLDPDDATAWCRRLVELIRDPGRRVAMGKRGRRLAADRFAATAVRTTLRTALELRR
ncbi:glycosyltransferase family 4 protein [Propionibacteriaceae bacterium Y2011]